MPEGFLLFRSYNGEDVRVRVRECPDPSLARRGLEQAFEKRNGSAAVRWQPIIARPTAR